jgi:hypothetical protein
MQIGYLEGESWSVRRLRLSGRLKARISSRGKVSSCSIRTQNKETASAQIETSSCSNRRKEKDEHVFDTDSEQGIGLGSDWDLVARRRNESGRRQRLLIFTAIAPGPDKPAAESFVVDIGDIFCVRQFMRGKFFNSAWWFILAIYMVQSGVGIEYNGLRESQVWYMYIINSLHVLEHLQQVFKN